MVYDERDDAIAGGQGRDAETVERDGAAVGVALGALLVVGGLALLVAGLVREMAVQQ